MGDSTAATRPDKPYPEFPLYPHRTKRWAKKIKGRTHYFGHWDDWQAALERYQYEVHYLQQGRQPPPQNQDAVTIDDLVNGPDGFLAHCEAKVNSGELAQITFDDYKRAGAFLIKSLGRYADIEGLTPADFAKMREKLAARFGLVALGVEIQRCRAFFNFGVKNGLLDKPAAFGMAFNKPTRSAVLREKQAKPQKIFTVKELQTLYHAAGPQMKAFMLLALNGGLGNADIGRLEFRHIKDGWIDFPRPKTTVARSFPLWKETQRAIDAAKQTKGVLPFVFVTKYGTSWHKLVTGDSPLSNEFRKLCDECKLYEPGRGFYSLRHQFRTVADGCRDTPAINHIMGHSDGTMGANYRQWIEPERLQAVVDHVYQWVKPMFRKPRKKGGAA